MTEQDSTRVRQLAQRPQITFAWLMFAGAVITTIPAFVALGVWVTQDTAWWPREVIQIVALPLVFCAVGIVTLLSARACRKVVQNV